MKNYLNIFGRGSNAAQETDANTAPEIETRNIPTIELVFLIKSLAGFKSRTHAFASSFRREEGFMGIFSQIAAWLVSLWAQFESSACNILVKTQNEAASAMSGFNPDSLIGSYTRRMEQLGAWLEQQLHGVLTASFVREQKRITELKQLEERKPDLEMSLDIHTITMAGDPDARIQPVNYRSHYASAFLVFILLIVIEGMAGYDMFEFSGSSLSAIAWSLITVAILALTSYFGGSNAAIVDACQDAKDTFRRKYPKGLKDKEGKLIFVRNCSRGVQNTARWCTATLVLWSIGLVAWRVATAMSDTKNFGWNAVFGSVGMAVFAFVYYFIERRFAPKYEASEQNEWQWLVDEIAHTEATIHELSAPDPNDPYTLDRNNLVETYNKSANEADDVVTTDIRNRQEIASDYLSLVGQYRSAYRRVRNGFHTLCQEAANSIAARVKDLDVDEFTDPVKIAQVDRLFESQVVPTLEDDSLVAKAVQFQPQVELPANVRIRDFSAIEQKVLAQVSAEFAAKVGSGAMRFDWRSK